VTWIRIGLALFATSLCVTVGSPDLSTGQAAAPAISESSIRGHMEFLASDALNGRASGSRDEWIAATYVGAQLREWGVEPLGDAGSYVQIAETRGGGHTWNAIGRLAGRDAAVTGQVILLTAHIDHLGVRGSGPDTIYNGADDDASGTTAVLALAEALAKGRRPRRTVIFAVFGSEETDGSGAGHFIDAPPVPLDRIVANLEFEMIGRPDPKLPPHTLWLTGYERSNLGPDLARHGARIVADPRPEQHFFERSDNIQFAERGVIAQAVSSFGLHHDYHQPSDDLAHVDFAHMTEAIRSLLEPVLWLANSTFTPEWRPGGRPGTPGTSGTSGTLGTSGTAEHDGSGSLFLRRREIR
jgi:hypothetical protein